MASQNLHSRHFLVPNQQLEHGNNVWNPFKISIKIAERRHAICKNRRFTSYVYVVLEVDKLAIKRKTTTDVVMVSLLFENIQ